MPCLDCGKPGSGSRCNACLRAHRGTTTERGYGHDYQLERAVVLEDATHCSNCGDLFSPENPATGGHVDPLRDGGTLAGGLAPQCRACNYGWRRSGL